MPEALGLGLIQIDPQRGAGWRSLRMRLVVVLFWGSESATSQSIVPSVSICRIHQPHCAVMRQR